MIDGKLQDFVSNVIARGQITFGDVRRLQRRYLPNGLTRRDDVEMLISLNAQLDRADRSWAEWLTAAVTDSAKREDCGPAIEDAAATAVRSEEHTSELQSHVNLVCRLLLEKKNTGELADRQRSMSQ